jgi:hypothetical protein
MSKRVKSFLRHTFLGGESLIAMGSMGRELIHEEQWLELPEEERGKWEAVDLYHDESAILYRRKGPAASR